jgi:hypothetical protein
LVGLFPKNKNEKFDAGTILCEVGKIKGFGIGRITAVTHSPALGHWIGLGFVKGGVNNWKNIEIVGSDPIRNNEVRIDSSLQTDNISSRCYLSKNNSYVKKHVPTHGNSTKSSVTSLKPGSLSAIGYGVHKKHGSYQRRLLDLKQKCLNKN